MAFQTCTVATEQHYEYAVYPPGTPVVNAIPAVESLAAREKPEKCRFAKLENKPLYVHEVEFSSERSDLADAMVNQATSSNKKRMCGRRKVIPKVQ